jgi:hypothetical protein
MWMTWMLNARTEGGRVPQTNDTDVIEFGGADRERFWRTRRRKLIGGSALALVVAVVVFATVSLGQSPEPLQPAPATTVPIASASATVEGPPDVIPVLVPPGAIDLSTSTVDLPYSFAPCQGRVSFTGNTARSPMDGSGFSLRIEGEWTADVDRDGSPDTVALVACSQSEARYWQVVAVKRGPDGTVQTIGRVVETAEPPGPAVIFGLQIGPDGSIAVEVGDFRGLNERDRATISTRQVRTYRLDATTFRQVSGPSTFPPNPNFFDLAASATNLTLGRAVNGQREGTVKVTVRNRGPGAANDVELRFVVPVALAAAGQAWAKCAVSPRQGDQFGVVCPVGTVKAGASQTMTLAFTAGSASHGSSTMLVEAVGRDALGFGYPLDFVPDNNQARIELVGER